MIFQNNDLKITTESNLLEADFLDITLNEIKEKYWPYRKHGVTALYINANSNHSSNIKKKTIILHDLITLIKKFKQLRRIQQNNL